MVGHINQLSDTILVGHLHIRQGGEAPGTPMDHALRPVEGPVFIETDKDLPDRPGEPRVHGEAFMVPGEGGSEPSDLIANPRAD